MRAVGLRRSAAVAVRERDASTAGSVRARVAVPQAMRANHEGLSSGVPFLTGRSDHQASESGELSGDKVGTARLPAAAVDTVWTRQRGHLQRPGGSLKVNRRPSSADGRAHRLCASSVGTTAAA